MAGERNLDALRQEPLAPALATAGQSRATPFSFHAGTKPVLALTRPLGRLVGPLHGIDERREIRDNAPLVNGKGVLPSSSFSGIDCVMSDVAIESATAEDLDELSELLGELFSEEKDFRPNKDKQMRGLRLIFEQPNRGRVFVLRRDRAIVGMINLLFTISTAEGGFVLLLEDLVIHDSYRDKGYGSMLLDYAVEFARQKNFLRITLLTDRPEIKSQAFFKRHGFFESSMIPMRLLVTPETPTGETSL